MEQTYETPNVITAPVRNTFLTILCVLTFIGSGYGVYKGISGYFTADAAAQMVSQTKTTMDDQMAGKEQPAMVKNLVGGMFDSMSADNIRKSSLISLLSNLLTLGGAILMWTLRKVGLYLYIAGIVIAIAAPLILFGGGLIGLASSGVTALIGVVFIVLYAVNAKYMVN